MRTNLSAGLAIKDFVGIHRSLDKLILNRRHGDQGRRRAAGQTQRSAIPREEERRGGEGRRRSREFSKRVCTHRRTRETVRRHENESCRQWKFRNINESRGSRMTFKTRMEGREQTMSRSSSRKKKVGPVGGRGRVWLVPPARVLLVGPVGCSTDKTRRLLLGGGTWKKADLEAQQHRESHCETQKWRFCQGSGGGGWFGQARDLGGRARAAMQALCFWSLLLARSWRCLPSLNR